MPIARPRPSTPRAETATASADAPPARTERLVLAAVLLLGAALRTAQLAYGRPLWLDEAMLAVSIVTRPLGALLTRHLEYGQAAPSGFLALSRLCVAVFGTGEAALRLPAYLAGLVSLAAFFPVARRALRPVGALLAAFFFAIAPLAVYYSAEAKPYGFDPAAVLVVTLATFRAWERPDDGRRWAVLALAGAVSVWFSFPVVFAMAAAGGALAVAAAREKRIPVRAAALAAVAWAASFAASYLASRANGGSGAFFRWYWQSGFVSLTSGAGVAHALARAWSLFPDVLEFAVPVVGAVAAIGGAGWMIAKRRFAAAVILLPVPLAFAAAVAHVYPFGGDIFAGGRVLVFLIPALVTAVAAGIDAAFAAAGVRPAVLAAVALLAFVARMEPIVYVRAFLAVPAIRPLVNVPRPFPRELYISDVRPVVKALSSEFRPGDVIYVYADAVPAFRYYAARQGLAAPFVAGTARPADGPAMAAELSRLRGNARVWIVFAHTPGGEDRPILGYLSSIGRPLEGIHGDGASLYLFDLSTPAGPFLRR